MFVVFVYIIKLLFNWCYEDFLLKDYCRVNLILEFILLRDKKFVFIIEEFLK